MKRISFLFIIALFGTLALAQEGETKNVNIDINTGDSGDWYSSPWVWVIGAAIIILLLVALTRGGRRVD